MKVLILNASPRREGNIAQLLEVMRRELEGRGVETVCIRVAELQVRPCIGCMKCRSALSCCLPEDGAQLVLRRLEEADVLIVGAPCYWGNMPGALKLLFDRMVYGMMGESACGVPRPLHKGKRAVIVSTSTTPYPFNILFNQTRGVVKALKEILKWSGFKITATLEKGGTRQHPEPTERELRRCRKVIGDLLQ